MTIIAYKDGFMAADSAVWCNDVIRGHRKKIFRPTCGGLAGATGNSGDIEAFADWLDAGMKGELKLDDFSGMWVSMSGNVTIFDRNGRKFSDMLAPFYADGACADVALGAMKMGASAEQAVAICIDLCAWAAGTIQSESLACP